eukprot:CAMPEP_0206546338 /NCGR_PEP_ID=MMETSP0325_2-20121206/12651_1 /ASSEMBLY_ACC=CAM_ASM_000347 /TAXON_ID=2866 /ORGANISM="Crypthecodinium cohnii, Strain Seligo" /LENGTH=467 /DNA_ID=CAMNT_0054045453 /DNA_START=101 /DNA_END=1501 /DNA_ORIENTATION=-
MAHNDGAVLEILSSAIKRQVAAYDERFRRSLEEVQAAAARLSSAAAQERAYGQRDATGIEAVHDAMPTEQSVFSSLIAESAEEALQDDDDGLPTSPETPSQPSRFQRQKRALQVLDFGCGDGRYLRQFLRSAEHLHSRYGRGLSVVCYEVSVEALRSFHFAARQAGLKPTSKNGETAKTPLESPISENPILEFPSDIPSLDPAAAEAFEKLEGHHLQLRFLLGSAEASATEVQEQLLQLFPAEHRSRPFDVVVIGWGTLSSIPRLPHLSPDSLLEAFAAISYKVMNVASTINNHVKFQREFAAKRQALEDVAKAAEDAQASGEHDLFELKQRQLKWLHTKVGLANFPRSYYYKVNTGQWMFYAAITAEDERRRLEASGFTDVQLHICNIINFFDISTKPRAAKINAAVIRLLERGDVWGAQLLLSKAVAKAYGRPLSELNCQSCMFNGESVMTVFDQVARYFISTGR